MPVSRECAVALKELGFDEPTNGFYWTKSNYFTSDKLKYQYNSENHNYSVVFISAPDHLQAADWLWGKFAIEFQFNKAFTKLIYRGNNHMEYSVFSNANHRYTAILKACEIAKELKHK